MFLFAICLIQLNQPWKGDKIVVICLSLRGVSAFGGSGGCLTNVAAEGSGGGNNGFPLITTVALFGSNNKTIPEESQEEGTDLEYLGQQWIPSDNNSFFFK